MASLTDSLYDTYHLLTSYLWRTHPVINDDESDCFYVDIEWKKNSLEKIINTTQNFNKHDRVYYKVDILAKVYFTNTEVLSDDPLEQRDSFLLVTATDKGAFMHRKSSRNTEPCFVISRNKPVEVFIQYFVDSSGPHKTEIQTLLYGTGDHNGKRVKVTLSGHNINSLKFTTEVRECREESLAFSRTKSPVRRRPNAILDQFKEQCSLQ